MTNQQKRKYGIYIAQLAFVFFIMLFTLVTMDWLSDPPIFGIIGASSISSSIFIIFTRPKSKPAKYSNIAWGYFISIIVGIFFHYILTFTGHNTYGASNSISFESLSALSIVSTTLLFWSFKIDNPPAVGMTFGLVLEHWNILSLLVIFCDILLLLLARYSFKKKIPHKNNHL